jgi:hypothetical protein
VDSLPSIGIGLTIFLLAAVAGVQIYLNAEFFADLVDPPAPYGRTEAERVLSFGRDRETTVRLFRFFGVAFVVFGVVALGVAFCGAW